MPAMQNAAPPRSPRLRAKIHFILKDVAEVTPWVPFPRADCMAIHTRRE